jgi:hypothetical protein
MENPQPVVVQCDRLVGAVGLVHTRLDVAGDARCARLIVDMQTSLWATKCVELLGQQLA